jgi:hypothetical protein
MINIVTSHTHIWAVDQMVVDIINEYQQQGHVTISMNREGPCNDAIGLYKILDYICDKFLFTKSKITIITHNAEENHPEYTIQIKTQHWIRHTYHTSIKNGYKKDNFYRKKDLTKNLFGCLYNVPSWNRLSLLAYIKQNTQHPSLLACNGTWEPHQHNSYYLNSVTDFCPEEFFNISRLIESGIGPLPGHPGNKPDGQENTQILCFYNDFFVDVVAETYSNGLAFFITEKTLRPMFALTPFIIFGPQGFLSTLRSDYGFKTFGSWWDEAYDNYQNYERIQQMYRVIDYIDSKSTAELSDMYNDMIPTLEHNHNRLKELNESAARIQK